VNWWTQLIVGWVVLQMLEAAQEQYKREQKEKAE
jgi:hypothetical protein